MFAVIRIEHDTFEPFVNAVHCHGVFESLLLYIYYC
jgi:hypothetical protein